MPPIKLNNRAFSLIELVMVIGIITVIVLLGYPRHKDMNKTAMQVEARNSLRQILVLQEAYLAENGSYVRNLSVACPSDPATCDNRIAITRTTEASYDPTATATACHLPNNNNPANNNYHIARLGFKVNDCRTMRYFYGTNGYFNVAREVGTAYNNSDRRVFPGCTDRFDTWVLTSNNEMRHSGRATADQNYLTTTAGYDANYMCRN